MYAPRPRFIGMYRERVLFCVVDGGLGMAMDRPIDRLNADSERRDIVCDYELRSLLCPLLGSKLEEMKYVFQNNL